MAMAALRAAALLVASTNTNLNTTLSGSGKADSHHDVEYPRKPSADNPRRPDDDLYSTPRMYGSNRCP